MIEAAAFLKEHPQLITEPKGDPTQGGSDAAPDDDATDSSISGLSSTRSRDASGPGSQRGAGTGEIKLPPARGGGHFGVSAAEDGRNAGVPAGGHAGGRSLKGKHGRRSQRLPKRGGFGARGSATAGDGPRDPADADACREAALTLLDAAARPRKALAQRLAGKGYDELVIETTVSRLEELGLVDDEAYAEGFLRYCLKRNLGERGAVREMVRKGLERPLAEQVVAKAVRQGLFIDSAYELGRKVACKTQGMDLQKRKRRLWAAAGRKGHSPEAIRQVAADLFTNEDL